MTTRKVVVLVCDLCGGELLVETHRLSIDAHAVELEACDRCWTGVVTKLGPVAAASRPAIVEKSRRVSRKAVAMPGTSWRFTSHALVRMGERHLDPTEVAQVADNPEIERPGREEGCLVRVAGPIKVVVDLESRAIITASRRAELEAAG